MLISWGALLWDWNYNHKTYCTESNSMSCLTVGYYQKLWRIWPYSNFTASPLWNRNSVEYCIPSHQADSNLWNIPLQQYELSRVSLFVRILFYGLHPPGWNPAPIATLKILLTSYGDHTLKILSLRSIAVEILSLRSITVGNRSLCSITVEIVSLYRSQWGWYLCLVSQWGWYHRGDCISA